MNTIADGGSVLLTNILFAIPFGAASKWNRNCTWI